MHKNQLISVRVTPETYIQFDKICRKSGTDNKSEVFRNMVTGITSLNSPKAKRK